MTEKRKLRAGVIGLGVGEKHIEGYTADPRCEVVRICDFDEAKLTDVAGRHPGPETTLRPEDVLNDPEIDVVSIASYDNDHRDQVVAALEAGKHVFVEKPLCLFEEELEDIAAVLKAHPNLKLSSNLILRKSPRFVALRDRILNAELGDIYYVEGDYNYGRLHKITEGWRGDIPFYSVVHGGSIHLIDLLQWLTGKRVTEVTAMGAKMATRDTRYRFDDTVAALMRFQDGSIGKVTANFPCVFPHFHNLSIYGTQASFVQSHNGGASFYQTRDPEVPPRPVEEAYPGAAKGDMLARFISSIAEGGDPEVTAQDVMDAMAVSLAIETSNRLGKTVEVRYH